MKRLLFLLPALLLGCGSNDGDPPAPAQGGGSGSSGAPASGGTGGTGGSTGSSGGSGGAVVVPSALDPALPMPSFDCSGDTLRACFSFSGTFNGVSFDQHCSAENPPLAFANPPPRWIISCGLGMPGEYHVVLDVPIQTSGTFDRTLEQDSPREGDVRMDTGETLGADVYSENLVLGRLAGVVIPSDNPAIMTAMGTFRGTWGEPQDSCRPGIADECVAASFQGNFRAEVEESPF